MVPLGLKEKQLNVLGLATVMFVGQGRCLSSAEVVEFSFCFNFFLFNFLVMVHVFDPIWFLLFSLLLRVPLDF